jgi:hypothetical protein
MLKSMSDPKSQKGPKLGLKVATKHALDAETESYSTTENALPISNAHPS